MCICTVVFVCTSVPYYAFMQFAMYQRRHRLMPLCACVCVVGAADVAGAAVIHDDAGSSEGTGTCGEMQRHHPLGLPPLLHRCHTTSAAQPSQQSMQPLPALLRWARGNLGLLSLTGGLAALHMELCGAWGADDLVWYMEVIKFIQTYTNTNTSPQQLPPQALHAQLVEKEGQVQQARSHILALCVQLNENQEQISALQQQKEGQAEQAQAEISALLQQLADMDRQVQQAQAQLSNLQSEMVGIRTLDMHTRNRLAAVQAELENTVATLQTQLAQVMDEKLVLGEFPHMLHACHPSYMHNHFLFLMPLFLVCVLAEHQIAEMGVAAAAAAADEVCSWLQHVLHAV